MKRIFQRRQRNEQASTAHPHGQHVLTSYPLVWLEDLVKTYTNDAGSFTALNQLSLGVTAGSFVSIVGKSGSGKSTLINMITGIDRPTSGDIRINNAALHRMSEEEIARWRRANLGIVFQFFQLLPTLTVVENILLAMEFGGMIPLHEQQDRAMALLREMDIAEQADKLPTALSGGQQQRVAIARALANDPPLIVADEPTGNLDSKTADHVIRQFERMVDGGKTVIIVTHDDELAQRASRIIGIADGRLVSDDSAVKRTQSMGHREPVYG